MEVETIQSNNLIVNPNGATNYRGEIVFAAEGQNSNKPSELIRMNPNAPYNTTGEYGWRLYEISTQKYLIWDRSVLLNNFFGRQFNSLNDLAVHPVSKHLHFTDVTYGWLQSFRPSPNLPNQVYKYCEATGLVSVVADGFNKPNGEFSASI